MMPSQAIPGAQRRLPRTWLGRVLLALGLACLALLVTLNAGGYRYGVADQAFYLPAVEDALDPALFPHDQPLLDAQDGLEVFDELSAAASQASGLPVPWLFALGYVAGLGVLLAATVLVGRRLYASWWAVAALGLAVTLRHRITSTGVNTAEGYLHPRMLAFALGVAAVSAYLAGRRWVMVALIVAAGVMHPTIGAWFGVWLGVAAAVAEPAARRRLVWIAAGLAAMAAWAVALGPLNGRLVVMDADWLAVLRSKDYLFPAGWPIEAWVINLAYPFVVVAMYRMRRAAGLADARETGLVAGALVLVSAFLVTLPLVAMKVALAVQLQIPRMFWMLDLLATIYVVWLLVDRPRRHLARWRVVTVTVLALASLGRGYYVTVVEGAAKPRGTSIARLEEDVSDWDRVMAWLEATPPDTHVLVDPGHAWRYGTSVRAAARRDVFLEEVKDAAIAIYSRDVAMRVAERTRALDDFARLDAARAISLAARYDLDYLVTDRPIDLPVVFRAGALVVYRLPR